MIIKNNYGIIVYNMVIILMLMLILLYSKGTEKRCYAKWGEYIDNYCYCGYKEGNNVILNTGNEDELYNERLPNVTNNITGNNSLFHFVEALQK